MSAEIIHLAHRLGADPLQPPKLENEIDYAQRMIAKVIDSLRAGDLLGTANGLEYTARFLRQVEAGPRTLPVLARSRGRSLALIRRLLARR